jgi:hypothetical protein
MLVQSTPRSRPQVVKIPQCIDHHFLTTNYSMECRTRRNRQQFRRNSACFAVEKNLGIQFQTFLRRENPRNSVPNHFSEEKTLGILFWTISRKRKTLGIRFRTISWKKPTELRSEPFLDEKNLRIPFWIIFGREKSSEFRSESFSEEKKLGNFVPNHFWKRKKLRKRQLLLAAS